LTAQKDQEQAETLIRKLTEQLKATKQDAHLKSLELQKSRSQLSDAEFSTKKLRKDNEFLMAKLEKLDQTNQELTVQLESGGRRSLARDSMNELGELEEGNADQLEELQDELTEALRQNQQLQEDLALRNSQHLEKVTELEQTCDDSKFELQSSQEK
jgi:hypothetical protein